MKDNIKELFIPYKYAKIINNLGFNEDTFKVYDAKGFLQDEKIMDELDLVKIKAPIYQQAEQWLWDNHKIIIKVSGIFVMGQVKYKMIVYKESETNLKLGRELFFNEPYDYPITAHREGILKAMEHIKMSQK